MVHLRPIATFKRVKVVGDVKRARDGLVHLAKHGGGEDEDAA